MFDGRWRHGVDRLTGPVGHRLVRWRVTADVLTASGLVFAAATAVVVATGHLLVGIPLLALTGFHDLFDGPVAKASGTASVRGALLDSVTDRVADAVLMGGVAWYLVAAHHGEMSLLPLAVLGAASLVSYVRAKAEALGLPTTGGVFGGLMERAERMILLGAGFLEPWLLVPVLWVLLGLTLVTAIARFAGAYRCAEGPARDAGPSGSLRPARPAPAAQGPELRVPSPWRARREGAAALQGAPDGPSELGARWRARRREAPAGRGARAWARRERATAVLGRHHPAGVPDPAAGDRGR